jgi:hypothetical protein
MCKVRPPNARAQRQPAVAISTLAFVGVWRHTVLTRARRSRIFCFFLLRRFTGRLSGTTPYFCLLRLTCAPGPRVTPAQPARSGHRPAVASAVGVRPRVAPRCASQPGARTDTERDRLRFSFLLVLGSVFQRLNLRNSAGTERNISMRDFCAARARLARTHCVDFPIFVRGTATEAALARMRYSESPQ